LEKIEQAKASVQAKVEHPFHVVKSLFRHRKTQSRVSEKHRAAAGALSLGQSDAG
jgi:IS5 family transposase